MKRTNAYTLVEIIILLVILILSIGVVYSIVTGKTIGSVIYDDYAYRREVLLRLNRIEALLAARGTVEKPEDRK